MAKIIPAGRLFENQKSKNQALAKLFRKLFLTAARNSLALKQLPGIRNSIADALPRQQVLPFKQLAPKAEAEVTSIG